jgi:FkbM family methyltransferase
VAQSKHTHHEVFSRYQRWSGVVPAGFEVDFHGARSRTAFFRMMQPHPQDRDESPTYPPFDEEYFEWIDLLEAVALARGRFTMMELGAGFGRWIARGAAAARQRELPCHLVAVEAEPTHFEWMIQNLQDNGVGPEDCRLVCAAVTGKDGKVGFQTGDAATSYGQSIGGTTEVEAVSLATLLGPLDTVDLIDLDVQGAELEVLTEAVEPLKHKVKRVHVETHSGGLHADIHRLFRRLGWKPHFLYEGNTVDWTPWGRINFQGGTQSWLNPRLNSVAELRSTRTLQNSAGWRTLATGRRILNRMAPGGTTRRKVIAAPLHWLATRYQRDSEDAARRPVDW